MGSESTFKSLDAIVTHLQFELTLQFADARFFDGDDRVRLRNEGRRGGMWIDRRNDRRLASHSRAHSRISRREQRTPIHAQVVDA